MRELAEAGLPAEVLNLSTRVGSEVAGSYSISGVPAAVLLDDDRLAVASWQHLPSAAEVLEEVYAHVE